jgi:hypothetical protein
MRGQNDGIALMLEVNQAFFVHLALLVQIIVAFGIKLRA